jgi:hypothetical protein
MTTLDNVKRQGILLGKSLDTTVAATMAHIEPNVIKRRLLATTPPTDILHKATLINVALVLVYNHDVMALPVAPQHTAELHKEVLSFLRTRQVDGQTKQKRRLVAKKPLSAGLEMGGLAFHTLTKQSGVFSRI